MIFNFLYLLNIKVIKTDNFDYSKVSNYSNLLNLLIKFNYKISNCFKLLIQNVRYGIFLLIFKKQQELLIINVKETQPHKRKRKPFITKRL